MGDRMKVMMGALAIIAAFAALMAIDVAAGRQVRYFADARTGICFAKPGTGDGLAAVPCEQIPASLLTVLYEDGEG